MSFLWAKVDKQETVNKEDSVSAAEDLTKSCKTSKAISNFLKVGECEKSCFEEVTADISPIKNTYTVIEVHDQELRCDDKELDELLEEFLSCDSCGTISSNNDSDSELEEENDEYTKLDKLCFFEKDLISSSRGYKKLKKHGIRIKNYDVVVSGKKDYKPISLSNQIFKSLKVYSRKEEIWGLKSYDNAVLIMDKKIQDVLYQMIVDQILHSVDGIISIGEEAVILYATLGKSLASENNPRECAIKIFKTTFSQSKPSDNDCIITDNYVFKKKLRNMSSKSAIWWAKKEMANLMLARRAGVSCPEVIKLKKNMLFMSFVGKHNKPAKALKYILLSTDELTIAYEEVKNAMKTLYRKANLIHGDLSEYNILWHDGHCYFIDFSQAVEPSHEHSFSFLYRDCVNITSYFGKRIPEVDSADGVFKFITGFNFGNRIILENLRMLYKLNPYLIHKPSKLLHEKTSSVLSQATARAMMDAV